MKYIEISRAGGPEVLTLKQGEIPQLQCDEVLIKVAAAGVNRPDILQREGKYPMPAGVTPIPGLEVSGVVASIGRHVKQFKVGDKVCALTNGGGYADYCVVPASQTLPIPAGLSFVEAAAIPETFFTVWANLFELGQLSAGKSVLIHGGASGIGTTAAMLARAFCAKVFTTVGNEQKVQALSHYGRAINYKTSDFVQQIKDDTAGEGVDVILDMVGADYFSRNLELLKKEGRLVIIGFMGGRNVENFDIQTVMLKRLTITGSTLRGRTPEEKGYLAQQLLTHVWPLLARGECKPHIFATYPMTEIQQAHQALDNGDHIGKVVITCAE